MSPQVWPPVPSVEVTQRGIVATAASGSTTVTFPMPFAELPVIKVTARRLTTTRTIAAASASATAIGVETYTLAGVQIAGEAHWEATGVLA